jgi:hypothetical protein
MGDLGAVEDLIKAIREVQRRLHENLTQAFSLVVTMTPDKQKNKCDPLPYLGL